MVYLWRVARVLPLLAGVGAVCALDLMQYGEADRPFAHREQNPGLLTHHQNLFRMLGCSGRPWR
jgi:hypothetical protein